MAQKFADGARAELATSITAASTSLVIVAGGSLFPTANTGTAAISKDADWFKLVVQDTAGIEIVYVRTHTAGSNTFSNVMRGQEGTTARAFTAPCVVGLRMTAADAAQWEQGGGLGEFAVVSTATTLSAGKIYGLDTATAAFTATLPASPTVGDQLAVLDASGSWDSKPPTLARNGSAIMGLAEDLLLDLNLLRLDLVFVGGSRGWVVS